MVVTVATGEEDGRMATHAKLTLTEFLALPETEPASELIDGEVVQKTMPTWDHGVIQRLLFLRPDALPTRPSGW